MKIQYMSDLHLEFSPMDVPKKVGDILVLAGDIHLGTHAIAWLESCAHVFKHVIYICGNHEFYGHCIQTLPAKIHKTIAGYDNDGDSKIFDAIPNVYFLQNQSIIIDGIKFIGTTMWSKASMGLRYMMSDFSKIKYISVGTYRKFSPKDAWILHNNAVNFIDGEIDDTIRNVIVTHHAPSMRSNSAGERYPGDPDFIATGYCTDLLETFSGRNISAWIHGHTHMCIDYEEFGIHVVSNQRGYIPDEPVEDFDPCKVIEI